MSIEAMKQALEALEKLFGIPEQFTGKGAGDVAVWTLGGSYRAQQAIPVLRQAIAEAEKQEPVAWMYESVCGNDFATRHKPPDYAKNIRPLYTHPPKREWVGLTIDECVLIGVATGFEQTAIYMIEAKLKEKNYDI